MRKGIALAVASGVLAAGGMLPAGALAATEDITFTAAGVERHALIDQPAASPKDLPVVLVLPREGMTAEDALTRFGPAISASKAVPVVLDALPCSRLGGATCWAPMEPGDRQAVDISATSELVRVLGKRDGLDITRLIALGESSGGAFAVTVTRLIPSVVDGALAISAFDPTRVVGTDAAGQVAFPLTLSGPSKIKQQKTMQNITIVRASNDTSIPPQLSKELYTRLATHGWQSKAALVTVGGVGSGDPALADPARITRRINALIMSSLHLDTMAGLQRRLAALGYMPAGAAGNESSYATEQAVMAFQGFQGLPRDGVAGASTIKALSTAGRPRPQAVMGNGRAVEVLIGRQVMLLEQDGKVVRAVHISTGAAGNTPYGHFSVYRKELMSWSRPFSSWMPYASYFTGGFAFHEYPYVPGYPASHGCVRVGSPSAPFVYEFARYNTPVYVH